MSSSPLNLRVFRLLLTFISDILFDLSVVESALSFLHLLLCFKNIDMFSNYTNIQL